MTKQLLMTAAALSTRFALACPPILVETVETQCRNYEEPEQTKVVYDQSKHEFRYALGYRQWQRVKQEWSNCNGYLWRTEIVTRETAGTIPFRQDEEGHTDFTLVRAIREYLKEHAAEACK